VNTFDKRKQNETETLLKDIQYFFEYDHDSGKVFHKNPKHSYLKGKEAGSFCSFHGYITLSVHRKQYKAHRIIWALYYGEFADGHIDHIDGNKSNNKITNLRCVDHSTNMGNQIRPQKGNKLGIKNIYIRHKPKFMYRLCLSDKNIPIIDKGFKRLKEAIKARNHELKKLGRKVHNIDDNEWLVYFNLKG
jgi:hypothetical protein